MVSRWQDRPGHPQSPRGTADWRTADVDDLCDALLALRTPRRGGRVPARRLLAARARGAVAPLARRPPARPGRPLRPGGQARARLDGDRHPRRALAAPRRGRLPARARPPGERGDEPAGSALALPSKGRMHAARARAWCARPASRSRRNGRALTRTARSGTSRCCSRAPTTSPRGRRTAPSRRPSPAATR